MTPEGESLARRLEAVEKELAELRGQVAEYLGTRRTIVARAFVVANESGERIAELGTANLPTDINAPERPCLSLFDQGSECVRLMVLEKGPCLDLLDTNGPLRFTVQVDKTHGPCAVMYDENGEPRVCLEFSSSGDASLTLFDATVVPRLKLVANASGESLLGLNGPTSDGPETPKLVLMATSDNASLLLGGNRGLEGPVAKIAVETDGASFRMGDSNFPDGAKLYLVVNGHQPHVLLSKDGKVLWSAP